MATSNINSFLKPIGAENNEMRDYKHASRTFVDNALALHPKLSNLYLCLFNFAPGIKRTNENEIFELPLMVKSVNLPNYSISVSQHNQYNKRVYSQNKLEYQDVSITFHDDAQNLTNMLWYKYMTHYYSDSLNEQGNFATRDRYTERVHDTFGYKNGPRDNINKFFSSIQIYTLFNGKFTEYTLANPIITSFNHGDHEAGRDEPLENRMTVSYEAVIYKTGVIDSSNPKTFAILHYDNEISPLGKNTAPVDPQEPKNFSEIASSTSNTAANNITQESIFNSKTNPAVTPNQFNSAEQIVSSINGVSASNEVIPVANLVRNGNNELISAQNIVNNENTTVPGYQDIPNVISSNGNALDNGEFNDPFFNEESDDVDNLDFGDSFFAPDDAHTKANPRKISDITKIRSTTNANAILSDTNITASPSQKTNELVDRLQQNNSELEILYRENPQSSKINTLNQESSRLENRISNYQGNTRLQMLKNKANIKDPQVPSIRNSVDNLTTPSQEF